jgi:hypothetical protein
MTTWSWAEGLVPCFFDVTVMADGLDSPQPLDNPLPLWVLPSGGYRLFGRDFQDPLEAFRWAFEPTRHGSYRLVRDEWCARSCTWQSDLSEGGIILERPDGTFSPLDCNESCQTLVEAFDADYERANEYTRDRVQSALLQHQDLLAHMPCSISEYLALACQPVDPIRWVIGFEGLADPTGPLAWGAAAIYQSGYLTNGVTQSRVSERHRIQDLDLLANRSINPVCLKGALEAFGVEQTCTACPALPLKRSMGTGSLWVVRLDASFVVNFSEWVESWRQGAYRYYVVPDRPTLQKVLDAIERAMMDLAARAIGAGLIARHDSPRLLFASKALEDACQAGWELASLQAREPLAGLQAWIRSANK